MLHTYTPQTCGLLSVIFLQIAVSQIYLEQDYKVHDHCRQVKSRYYGMANLHPRTNVRTQCELPFLYGLSNADDNILLASDPLDGPNAH